MSAERRAISFTFVCSLLQVRHLRYFKGKHKYTHPISCFHNYRKYSSRRLCHWIVDVSEIQRGGDKSGVASWC